MRGEWQERSPRHRLQRKPLVSDPSMHHGTCVTHVPWCMSGSQTHGCEQNVPGIPGACATHDFTYLARGPCLVLQQTRQSTNRAHNSKDVLLSYSSGLAMEWMQSCTEPSIRTSQVMLSTDSSYALNKLWLRHTNYYMAHKQLLVMKG